MKIAIGSDHAGFVLRKNVLVWLEKKGYDVIDCGTDNETSSNYAVEGIKVGENVVIGNADLGIVICGSGVGISIAANKVKGIRAALASTPEIAKLSREHNDANILALGARFISEKDAIKCVEIFLNTKYEGGRHANRVDTIQDYESCCDDC
ncbi:MAG: ribose 5-phosphate isomerase B [Mycoplasmatales bacterium]